MDVNTLTPNSPLLESSLAGLLPQPHQIYYRGNNFNNIMQMPRLTVVGSRRPTSYGIGITQQLTSAIAGQGIAIISGLALGIDSIAHQAALDAGTPTVAVLPGGIDTIAPRSHYQLAQRIMAQGGALISEYPTGYPVLRHNFVARDRLMAALGDAVLITEAAAKSGTMHTAQFALELGKPVLAVPGPITSPLSEGTNNLIKTGAITVTTVDDILLAMNLQPNRKPAATSSAFTAAEQAIIDVIRQGIGDGTTLQLQSKLSAADFNQALTMLELTGHIRALGGDYWSLC